VVDALNENQSEDESAVERRPAGTASIARQQVLHDRSRAMMATNDENGG
jgi:hypothetical protein